MEAAPAVSALIIWPLRPGAPSLFDCILLFFLLHFTAFVAGFHQELCSWSIIEEVFLPQGP